MTSFTYDNSARLIDIANPDEITHLNFDPCMDLNSNIIDQVLAVLSNVSKIVMNNYITGKHSSVLCTHVILLPY